MEEEQPLVELQPKEVQQKKLKYPKKYFSMLGSLVGMVVGDALGSTYEFENITKINLEILKNPLVMKGGGGPSKNFNLKPGQWTDDASQGLCLIEAFLKNIAKGGFEAKVFMDLIANWWARGHNAGKENSVGLGGVIGKTLAAWNEKKFLDPLESAFNTIFKTGKRIPGVQCDGNGSTMRCAAPSIYANSLEQAMYFAYLQSLVTTPGLQSAACAAFMAYLSYQAIHSKIEDPNELKEQLLSPESLKEFLQKLLELTKKFPEKYQIAKASRDYQLIESLCNSSPFPVVEKQMLKVKINHKTNITETTTTSKEIIDSNNLSYNEYCQKASNKGKNVESENIEGDITTRIVYKYKILPNDYLNWRVNHKAYQLDGPTSTQGYYGSYVMSQMGLILHILHNTSSFDEAAKMAALMRGDADSNAAALCIITGAIYGYSSICPDWIAAINQHPLNQGDPLTVIPFLEKAVKHSPQLVEVKLAMELEVYMKRIDGCGYNYGFRFFKDMQITNRKANYNLAKELHEKLLEEDINLVQVLTEFEQKQAEDNEKLTLFYRILNYLFGNIRSKELSYAIESAKSNCSKNNFEGYIAK